MPTLVASLAKAYQKHALFIWQIEITRHWLKCWIMFYILIHMQCLPVVFKKSLSLSCSLSCSCLVPVQLPHISLLRIYRAQFAWQPRFSRHYHLCLFNSYYNNSRHRVISSSEEGSGLFNYSHWMNMPGWENKALSGCLKLFSHTCLWNQSLREYITELAAYICYTLLYTGSLKNPPKRNEPKQKENNTKWNMKRYILAAKYFSCRRIDNTIWYNRIDIIRRYSPHIYILHNNNGCWTCRALLPSTTCYMLLEGEQKAEKLVYETYWTPLA